VQEVIVQNFRAVPGVPMQHAPEPDEGEVTLAVALARLVLDRDVSVQSPPNLNPAAAEALLAAGLNDFGGISPLTPDYINPRHPWPHLDALGEACARAGFVLRPRPPVYDRFVERPGFLDPALVGPTRAVQARLAVQNHEQANDLGKRRQAEDFRDREHANDPATSGAP
jgi:FO synthase